MRKSDEIEHQHDKDQLQKRIFELEQTQCSNLPQLMKQAHRIFEHDALARLRMVKFLHDFENAQSNISLVQAEFSQFSTLQQSFAHGSFIDFDELVHDVFFPQIKMEFSHKENPLQIVKAMEKQYGILREEMLLF